MISYTSILSFFTVFMTNAIHVRAQETCLSNPQLNEFFVNAIGGTSIPTEGSCCMKDVCNIPCPQTLPGPSIGYGIAVGVAFLIAFVLGVATYILIKGEAVNYFVAGKTFPMWMVAVTLAEASVDSNVLLGNVDLSYKFSFWDGVALPVGLALNLFLNAFTLGPKLNAEPNMLTLPDVFGNRYGVIVEVLCSMCCIVSFLMLLAGNLVGTGVITSYVWGTTQTEGIWIAAILIWSFTVAGGLFSIAYTDVALGAIGGTGCLICAFWLIANATSQAPVVSIGFPGYIYPTTEACEMYNGTACANDATQCCYNEALWCPSDDNCRTDNGAYPFGDKWYYKGQMTDPYALTPFPNGIFWNWATIIILMFGNLGALDFQVRCMASKTPNGVKWGCIIAALFTLAIGVPFGFLGAITRYHYGPDSVYAEFDVDTCSTILGLPTCGAWIPDPSAFMKLLTFQTPPWMGAWCMVGIIAASMSTANGAILAMGTVFAHNIMRQLDVKWPNLVTSKNLLLMARLSTIPFTIVSALIASSSKKTGYLLIVAFDVVLASVVPALVGAFYLKKPSSRAALCSVVSGIIIRVTLEFTLPKDGSLILPFSGDEFMNYGTASSTKLPTFVDGADNDVWDPTTEVCAQEQYKDYTGVDSLSAFAGSIIVLLTVYFIEQYCLDGRPLFVLPGMVGYYKKIRDDDDSDTKKIDTTTKINYSKSGFLEINDDNDHKSVKESESETGRGIGSSDEGSDDYSEGF